MASQNSASSHRRDIVSRLTHDDPEKAAMLIELMLLTDSQTPLGAAAHSEVISQAYEMTEDCRKNRDRFMREMKERLGATQIATSQ